MFKVEIGSDPSICSMPITLQITNADSTPNISNVWILQPGEFSFIHGTPLTFDRTVNPYRLSNTYKQRFANGVGIMRMTSYGYMSWTNESEVWEAKQINDYSWNEQGKKVYQYVGFAEFRAIDYINVSPYVYGDFHGLVGSSYPLTLNDSVSDTDTTFSINAGPNDPWEIPITSLLLSMGSGELCRIRLVTATTITLSGTASMSGNTITGVGTDFTSALVSMWVTFSALIPQALLIRSCR